MLRPSRDSIVRTCFVMLVALTEPGEPSSKSSEWPNTTFSGVPSACATLRTAHCQAATR